ncbi:MAG: tetratricopeptide repeat protein [Alphaproteobacteria bacterium]
MTAADQGLAAAQFLLATLYAEGNGVAEDQETAVTWYRRAADQGYPLAMHNLAAAYLRGVGIEQSRTLAYAWFQLVLQLYPEDSPNRETAQTVYDQLAARLPQAQRDEADSFAVGWEPNPE